MQSTVGPAGFVRHQNTAAGGANAVSFHWSRALPRPPERIVRRDRLHAVIDEKAALVVVQGPAGFGKTTLVAEWAHAHPQDTGAIVWMDATHSTPQTFWSDVAAAFSESGIILDGSAKTPYAAIHAAVQARSSELTLVLDRFDTVANLDIRERLHELIVRRRWLRVIACVRRRGIFDSILWSDLAINAIRAHDLAFTIDETAQLARVLGADMHDDDIRSLRDAAQGWPEPTRALALELARTHKRGASVGIIAGRVARDYLRQRVLPEIEADGRLSFIFATAVPDSITGEIAQVLTGDAQSDRHLDRLESEGMIASTSESGEVVYRWPAAARTALRAEFCQRNPQDAEKLNAQLASWYLARKLFAPALGHALTANNPDLAVRIIDEGWPELLKLHLQELDAAIAVIPHSLIVAHPQAAAIRDIRLSLSSQTDELLLSLPDPLPNEPRKLEALARSPQARRAMSTATVMMIALRVRGRMAHAVHYADMVERIGRIGRFHQPDRILSQLPNDYLQVGITRGLADDLPGAIDILGFAYELAPHSESEHVAVDAAAKLALFHSLRGETRQATSWLDRYARPYRKSAWMKRWVSLSGSIAQTLTAIDRLDRPGATEAIAHVQNTARGEQSWSHFVTYTHARYALHWGDRVGALAKLREERIRRASWLLEGTTIRPLFDAAEADLLMALGQGNQVDELLARSDDHRTLDVARARFALLTGQAERALRAATLGLGRTGAHHAQAELMLIAASAEYRLGHVEAARESLREALANVRATGSLRPLATIPREELIALAGAESDASEVLDQVDAVSRPFPQELRMIEITEREQLILGRIADGASLPSIAEDLFVSRNTVKTQVRSLYLKLGVSSRDEAVARAHEYGLLSGPVGESATS